MVCTHPGKYLNLIIRIPGLEYTGISSSKLLKNTGIRANFFGSWCPWPLSEQAEVQFVRFMLQALLELEMNSDMKQQLRELTITAAKVGCHDSLSIILFSCQDSFPCSESRSMVRKFVDNMLVSVRNARFEILVARVMVGPKSSAPKNILKVKYRFPLCFVCLCIGRYKANIPIRYLHN